MQDKFGVRNIRNSEDEMMAALYLQVSIVSQALIFVTRSRSWSFMERPGFLLLTAFMIAQLVNALAFLLMGIIKDQALKPIFFVGCNSDSSVCELGFCKNSRLWLGMGWCNLALQYRLLFPPRHNEVCHPLHLEWKGMAKLV